MPKLYLINLPRSIARREAFEKQIPSFVSYERVIAVDGQSRDDTTIYSHLVPEYFGRGQSIKAGVFGVFCSHYKIWKKIVNNDDPYAIVMEDDTRVVGSAEDFQRAYDILSTQHLDVLFINRKATWWLDNVKDRNETAYSLDSVVKSFAPYKSFPPNPSSIGCDGYIISKSAAKKMIALTEEYRVCMDVDVFLVSLSTCYEEPMNDWVHFRHARRLDLARAIPRLETQILSEYITTNTGGELGRTTIHGMGKVDLEKLK